jgi:hypothetical protein
MHGKMLQCGVNGRLSGSNDNVVSLGRGDFFAVDRRTWAMAFDTAGLHAALAYLVLARGSLADMRTTSWSAEAINQRTRLNWRQAKEAIGKLIAVGLIRQDKGGSKPRYYIMPAHLIRGCEGFVAPMLTPEEKQLHERMRSARKKNKKNNINNMLYVPNAQEHKMACDLASRGYAQQSSPGSSFFAALDPKTAEAETPPEWIWLPNALVDGVSDETPPIEVVRESGRPAALRLLVDLYGAQSLAENGGVHWRQLRMAYERERVGQQGIYVVWGFIQKTKEAWAHVPFVSPHLTGEDKDAGWKIFWGALEILKLAGLVEFVNHVVDHDHDKGEPGAVIHPYGWPKGEPAERELAIAAHHAAMSMLADWQKDKLREEGKLDRMLLLPAKNHMVDVQLVGLARLKYRARSTATAAWMAKTVEWEALAKQFTDLAAGSKSTADAASC